MLVPGWDKMSGEISTIQSLKAVDAWIDVINANINGGVRTAFKSSRLKFGGSNVDVQRAGTSTNLPLQFPEPGLQTANTVIDFSQGAITASTENTHLAIQGEGFFLLVDPASMNANGTYAGNANTRFYLTRDGEFRTNQDGVLVSSNGYFLVAAHISAGSLNGAGIRKIYNDLDNTSAATVATQAIRLSDYVANNLITTTVLANGTSTLGAAVTSLYKVVGGKQSLPYTSFGSTVFDTGFRMAIQDHYATSTIVGGTTSDATILTKSLEASNASMTQSVPELSLAQKLFSALTKVLQTKQTNIDGVLNLVR
jgi:flagellar hook protein FlgE